jgi:hypothetical protein
MFKTTTIVILWCNRPTTTTITTTPRYDYAPCRFVIEMCLVNWRHLLLPMLLPRMYVMNV